MRVPSELGRTPRKTGKMLVAGKYIVLLALCSRSGAADDTNWTFYDKLAAEIQRIAVPSMKQGAEWAKGYDAPNYKDMSREDKIKDAINWWCGTNAVEGAGIAQAQQLAIVPGGLAAAPVVAGLMSASLYNSIRLQIAMVGAVVELRGFDVNEPRVQRMVLACIAGDIGTEGARKFAGDFSRASWERFLNAGIGPYVHALNRAVGYRLVVINGRNGAIRLADFTPVIGPAVSFFVDGYFCLKAAESFDWKFFDGTYKAREELKVWLDKNDLSGLQDVFMEEEFDMTSICIITEEHLEKLGIKMGQRLKFLAAQKADCTQLE